MNFYNKLNNYFKLKILGGNCMDKIIELYRGTNVKSSKEFLNGNFGYITWWSDDFETIDHYYEGSVIKIILKLVDFDKVNVYGRDYVSWYDEINEDELKYYKYGYTEVDYPVGAIWYSINGKYIKENLIEMEEVDIQDLKNKLI